MDVDSNSKPDDTDSNSKGEAGSTSPNKPDTTAEAKFDAQYCLISAQVLKKCIKSMAKYEKREGLKRACWWVKAF